MHPRRIRLPSFLLGAISVFDIFGLQGTARVQSLVSRPAADVLRDDWRAIGGDLLRAAMREADMAPAQAEETPAPAGR